MLIDYFIQLHGADGPKQLDTLVERLGRQILVEDGTPRDLSHLLPEPADGAVKKKAKQKKSELLIAQGWGLQGSQISR